MGDRSVDFGYPPSGDGIQRIASDGCGRFEASDLVQKRNEGSEGDSHNGGVVRVVVVTDGKGEVIEGGNRVSVSGLETTENIRQMRNVITVTTVLSYCHTSA